MTVSKKKHLKLLQDLVKRAGSQGKAAYSVGLDVSTVKRYLNGTLTIPEKKANVMRTVMNLSDDAFEQAITHGE